LIYIKNLTITVVMCYNIVSVYTCLLWLFVSDGNSV